jgi:hypothetical protein
MATKFYADRGFVTINGVELGNLKSVKWMIDEAVTAVETMTRNKRAAGYKQGNRKVSGSFELEVEDQKGQIDLAFQYGNDVTIICQLGTAGERWQLKGLVQNSQDLSGSVGEAGKTIAFTCLDAVNENGPGVNAQAGF